MATSNDVTTKLNFDILARMMTFITRGKHLLAVMRSCHALYQAGVLPLVRLAAWSVDEYRLSSFYAFMINHSPISFIVFDHLCISCREELSDAHNKMLIDLLERSTALQELEVDSSAVLDMDSGVPQAIASLTTLSSLTFSDPAAEEEINYILANLHSPLDYVSVFFVDDCEDPVPLLANFRQTLEQATFICVQLESTEFSYSRLTHLDLRLCYRPKLSVLMTAFPNLEDLKLDAGDHIGVDPEEHPELEALRASNIQFQHDNGPMWKSLESVTADIASLFMLGLHMEIDGLYVESSVGCDVDAAWLRATLTLVSPKTLRLSCWDSPAVLAQTFRVGMDNLARLIVSLECRDCEEYQDLLDALVTGLASVNTDSLVLNITRCYFGDSGHWDATKRFFEQVGHKALADLIFPVVPNLKALEINFGSSKRSSWIGWEEGNEKMWRNANE
ncbi:hypothetical protein NM688_g3027 [Phlebia brevispora]|uniref:Uncharacterized protein n=1 Tax=Phlebia brevispora TaxID=194682 RepID=A0ACC1T748_9APHY|nr:hypothetical protein NM688_g3027 [Phlebia brevispora]